MSIFHQQPKELDFRDNKWGHPEARFAYLPAFDPSQPDPYGYYEDDSMTYEEKLAAEKVLADQVNVFGIPDDLDVSLTEYDVPGCPEEPDTPCKARVYTPAGLKGKRNPVLFEIPGGGMYSVCINDPDCARWAVKFGCIVVVPIYRTALQGKYPASVNDCHAVYAWVSDHADELKADPDNVVLHGSSTGGQLSASLPFRIMRYGFSPRGVVSVLPVLDVRCATESEHMFPGLSNEIEEHKSAVRWMPEGFNPALVLPEAYANHASVDDCIGYPPLFMHTTEFDTCRDPAIQFVQKVEKARSFAEFHLWGGLSHCNKNFSGEPCPPLDEMNETIDRNIATCFRCDLRRPWVYSDEK